MFFKCAHCYRLNKHKKWRCFWVVNPYLTWSVSYWYWCVYSSACTLKGNVPWCQLLWFHGSVGFASLLGKLIASLFQALEHVTSTCSYILFAKLLSLILNIITVFVSQHSEKHSKWANHSVFSWLQDLVMISEAFVIAHFVHDWI
jgi:hypothetical protein